MKLKELLKVIPDNYEVSLADYEHWLTIMAYYKKEEAVSAFAQQAEMTDDQILNLNVLAIHPGVNTHLNAVDMYGEDATELKVKTQLLIEVSTDEEEND